MNKNEQNSPVKNKKYAVSVRHVGGIRGDLQEFTEIIKETPMVWIASDNDRLEFERAIFN